MLCTTKGRFLRLHFGKALATCRVSATSIVHVAGFEQLVWHEHREGLLASLCTTLMYIHSSDILALNHKWIGLHCKSTQVQC